MTRVIHVVDPRTRRCIGHDLQQSAEVVVVRKDSMLILNLNRDEIIGRLYVFSRSFRAEVENACRTHGAMVMKWRIIVARLSVFKIDDLSGAVLGEQDITRTYVSKQPSKLV